MMRTSYKNHWMLAAILFCGLVMTSCSDQQGIIDNPVTPEPEQASAKDPGKWWIDENNMDKSVKPGDNFFMYCIGSWWKNATVDPKSHITTRLDFMKPNFDDKVRSLTDANYAIFKSHLKWADPNSETAASAQKLYDDVLKQSGLEEAKTSADVMRAYGKMCAMGVGSCIKLQPFCHDNNICLYVANPEVFIYEDMDKTPFLTPMSPMALILLQLWQGSFKDQPDGADILKNMVKLYHKNDYGFISQKTKEEYNIEINKDYERYNNDLNNLARTRGGDNTTTTTKTLSLKVLVQTMEHDYLPYLRSKMVADQLVPPGLKEEYQKYCDEMKGVFAQCIKNNDWLSDGSKKNALEKLDAMVFNVVYPDKWYTEGLTDFTKSQSLLEDIYTMRKASPADKAEFDRRTELLVKQFESYDVLPDEMPGVKANGKATIAENIADLGGMEIAWQAFINRLEADGYTGNELILMKQRFFLAYAEEYRSKYDANYVNRLAFGNDNPEAVNGHSMNKERVNGVVANMDGWYDAFDIEEGALYRKPAERIHI